MTLRDFIDMATTFGSKYVNTYISKSAKLNRSYINDEHDTDEANQEDIPYNMVKMSLKLNEDDTQLKSWVNTSTNDVRFRFPYQISPMDITALTLFKELTQQNSQYCGLNNREIITFDGVKYNYDLTDCWHVATKDVSGKSRIVILTRSLKNSTYLDVEINLDNYKVVHLSEDGVYINKEQMTISPSMTYLVSDGAGTSLLSIEQTIDFAFSVQMPAHGFKLIYTNTSAVIYTHSGMQNRLAGLCGDYNLETYGEFTSPNGDTVNSAFQFGSSYSFQGNSCAKYF